MGTWDTPETALYTAFIIVGLALCFLEWIDRDMVDRRKDIENQKNK